MVIHGYTWCNSNSIKPAWVTSKNPSPCCQQVWDPTTCKTATAKALDAGFRFVWSSTLAAQNQFSGSTGFSTGHQCRVWLARWEVWPKSKRTWRVFLFCCDPEMINARKMAGKILDHLWPPRSQLIETTCYSSLPACQPAWTPLGKATGERSQWLATARQYHKNKGISMVYLYISLYIWYIQDFPRYLGLAMKRCAA